MKEYESIIESNIYSTVAEPNTIWGGEWTEQKLDTFEKYVNAYLTIMNKYRKNKKLIYFDGFAGSGTREKDDNNNQEQAHQLLLELQQEEDINIQDFSVYKGAAERVLRIEQAGFDYYYFIDKDQISNNKLKSKLSSYGKTHKLEFRANDANEEINKLTNALHGNSQLSALVLLDPFGMQINWDTLARFANLSHIDLWILVPTGVIINRLLDRKADLVYIDKLVSFLGLDETEIRHYFYEEKTVQTLFGESKMTSKIEQPIKKIAELYISRLKTIFKEVTEQPLVMYNTRNVPIYHFVFASNNATALKIANQIINKKR